MANTPSEGLQLYEILSTLNRGFEQVLDHRSNWKSQPWKALRVIAEENRAEVNFELVEQLAEPEERDWTYFGWLRHNREKKLRDPQDVLIEANRLRQQTDAPGTLAEPVCGCQQSSLRFGERSSRIFSD